LEELAVLEMEVLRLERKNEGQPQWSPQFPEGVGYST
jgi:hypothetical protein